LSALELVAIGVQLKFSGSVDPPSADLGKVRSEAIRQVKAAYQRAQIEAPRTTYHIVAMRNRDADALDATVEPVHNGVDTSVNHEIDVQVANAIRNDANTNLLDPESSSP